MEERDPGHPGALSVHHSAWLGMRIPPRRTGRLAAAAASPAGLDEHGRRRSTDAGWEPAAEREAAEVAMPTWPAAGQRPGSEAGAFLALPLIRRIECRSTPLTTDIPLDEPGLAEDRGAGLGAQRRAPEHSSCGVRRRWAPMPPPPKAAERDAAEIYARMAMEENTRRAYRAAMRA